MKNKVFVFFMLLLICFLGRGGQAKENLVRGTEAYNQSLLSDLEERLFLPQTDLPENKWYTSNEIKGWGPLPRQYPDIHQLIKKLPKSVDVTVWKRDRAVAVAKHYIGLPYRHHYIPAWSPAVPNKEGLVGPGLDCSNFTAWVYNFGFGIMLNSDVVLQAKMEPRNGFSLTQGMRRLEQGEKFEPGDLLFIFNSARTEIAHVVIFVDEGHIIDDTAGGVAVRHFSGWYRTRFSHAIRVFN